MIFLENNKLTIKEKITLYNEIVPIAQVERKKILSDNQVICDTFQLLEQLGFFILRFPSNNDDLSGFHIKKSGINCIYINSNHTLGRQYFSAWHEYYHSITGEGDILCFESERKTSKIEYKAECFASCMLMPKNLIEKALKKYQVDDLNYISYKQIILMQKYFNVSYSAILTRLIQLYPNKKDVLGKRYSLSHPNKSKELLDKTIEYKGNTELIKPTRDVYVSQTFFEDINQNYSLGRISKDKVNSLIELLGTLDCYE